MGPRIAALLFLGPDPPGPRIGMGAGIILKSQESVLKLNNEHKAQVKTQKLQKI